MTKSSVALQDAKRPGASDSQAAAKLTPQTDLARRRSEVLLAFAVISLVMANRYQPRFLFFPVHAFHCALVFFAAGTLATIHAAFDRKLRFLVSSSKSRLGRFYGVNLVFAGVTLLLAFAGLKLTGSVPSFASGDAALASLGSFFFDPLTGAGRYELFAPGWILLALFVVAALFQLVCFTSNRAYLRLVLALAAVVTLVLFEGAYEKETGAGLFAKRTAFGFLFFVLGYLVRNASERERKVLTSPVMVVACYLFVDALASDFGNITYDVENGVIGNAHAIVPLAATVGILLLVYVLAHYTARIVSERSLLLMIGRSAFFILACHCFAFFLTNLALHALGFATLDEIANVRFTYELNKTWLLYLVPALALPVLLAAATKKLTKKPLPELS